MIVFFKLGVSAMGVDGGEKKRGQKVRKMSRSFFFMLALFFEGAIPRRAAMCARACGNLSLLQLQAKQSGKQFKKKETKTHEYASANMAFSCQQRHSNPTPLSFTPFSHPPLHPNTPVDDIDHSKWRRGVVTRPGTRIRAPHIANVKHQARRPHQIQVAAALGGLRRHRTRTLCAYNHSPAPKRGG